jgi:hypothetical protein
VPAPDDRTQGLERLRLLASAIAGRALAVAPAAPGERTWTDGRTIYIEADTGRADQVRTVGIQASLVAAGSLDPVVLRPLARRPDRTARYLAVEGHRALAVNESSLPPTVRSLLDRDLAAAVESPEASLAVARSRQVLTDAPRVFGVIDARRTLASVERATTVAISPGAQPPSAAGSFAALPEEREDGGTQDLGNLLSSPVGGGGAIGRLLRRLLAPARAGAGDGSPGADASTHVARAGGRAGAALAWSVEAPGPADQAPTFARPTARYAEWDVHRGGYRPNWCTVHEGDAPAGGGALVATPEAAAVRRPLARLGMGLTPCRRRGQGDDVDIDAAVEAHVDHLAGAPHADDLYLENLRRRRDLAVLVLLDVSGSAGEPGTSGRPVHEHQRSAAAALTVALHELGDRVALYAFNSRSRTAVQLLRVKDFDDRLDAKVARRLHGLEPAAYTRLGAAIRHGTALLEARGGTPRRLLVVLSDGFAYDHGYAGRYGEADARRALSEARSRGVGCLCLSVGADTDPDALRRVFGAAAHAMLPRAEDLPRFIGPLFRAALRTAEARRRTFQRTERARELLEIERRTDDSSRATVLRAGR